MSDIGNVMEGFLKAGINSGLTVLRAMGPAKFEMACEAGAVSAKIMAEIFPALKDGKITDEEMNAIYTKFRGEVDNATWMKALEMVKSVVSRAV